MLQIANYFTGGNAAEEFELVLKQNGYQKGAKAWVRKCLLEGAMLCIIGSAAMLYLNMGAELAAVALPACIAAPLAANYFAEIYRLEQRKRTIEKLVPDMLLQASAFPQGTPMHAIIAYISRADYASLSGEFARALSEIEKGAAIEEALSNIKKRNNSRILGRAINLLIEGYRSGADMSQTFRETADDLLETNSILRERLSALVIEKYTILFAGGLVVPLVLGLLVGLVSKMDFASLQGLEIGMSASMRREMLSSAMLANQLYISEYSILGALFTANQENNMKKAVLYAAVLLPLSLAVYSLAQLL